MNRRTFLETGAAATGALLIAKEGFADGESTPAQSAPAEVKCGGSRMVEIPGGHKVWVKKVGRGRTKVLLLHGGPGFSHDYLECMEDFLPDAGFTFYYYDQLGCGISDRPDDNALWTIERYVDEVEAVRKALGLDDFILFGQSWGGMLTMEYALKYPQHLRAIVISNMTASIPAYERHIATLKAAFPEDVIRRIDEFEARGAYDDPKYEELLFTTLYARHICRLPEWPEPVLRAFKVMNPKIYNHMQGPSEFKVTGTFKNWDRWADLPRIKAPTLLMVGAHDTMSVDDKRRMQALIPGSRLAVMPEGSHLCMYDDQARYFKSLLSFLREHDRPAKRV